MVDGPLLEYDLRDFEPSLVNSLQANDLRAQPASEEKEEGP